MARARLLMGIMGVLMVGAACAGGGSDGGQDGSTAELQGRVAQLRTGAHGGGGGGASAAGQFAPQQPGDRLPAIGPSIIKTAQVEVRVGRDGVQEAIQDATATAGRYGGFVLSTAVDDEGRRTGTIVLRVPADRFEAALADLEDLGEVRDENVAGEDVSQEFIDLEARLRNWRTQETVLLRLMDRAETIGQTIRVQGELQHVQLEIERIRGRLRFLEDQTQLSTITASFVATGVPPPSGPFTPAAAWDRAVELALGFVSVLIVSLGVVVPAAILLGIVLLLVRQLRLRPTS